MPKQKKNKQSTQISPENYIRQRARKLPIYKCLISESWKKANMATIFVMRQHASGNLTLATYMVDLMCLGVKDSAYRYNMPEETLQTMQQNAIANNMKFVEIPYNLAHNIIYASIDYAAEYGFEPAPEFTSVTQYILEEDDERIPLINIRCGDKDGKPFYVNTGADSPAKEQQALKQLDRTAGHGNYNYLLSADIRKQREERKKYEPVPKIEDEDDGYDAQLREEMRSMDEQALERLFCDFVGETTLDKRFTNQHEFYSYIFAIADVIADRLVDKSTVDECIEYFESDLDVEIIELFDLPNSFFVGLQCDDVEQFSKLWFKYIKKLAPGKIEPLKELAKITGDIPVIKYLELAFADYPQQKYDAKIKDYSQEYPGYLLFKIIQYSQIPELREHYKSILKEHNAPVTGIEYTEFLRRYTELLVKDNNLTLEQLLALETVVKACRRHDVAIADISSIIMLKKVHYLTRYFNKDKSHK